jgi:undecaprenyl-diphosphatase
MQEFDLAVLHYFNQFVRQSWAFDSFVKALSMNHLFKGGVMVALLWWAWFSTARGRDDNRQLILATIASCAIAETLARALSLVLPFRIRPVYDGSLPMTLPFSLDLEAMKLVNENSFPSDHAVLFFSLATSLWLIWRTAGVVALIYATIVIALPRIYLGLHYASDILGGAAIGMLVTLASTRLLSRMHWSRVLVGWSHTRPELFYPGFFLLTYQIADMFEGCRAVIGGVLKLLRGPS